MKQEQPAVQRLGHKAASSDYFCSGGFTFQAEATGHVKGQAAGQGLPLALNAIPGSAGCQCIHTFVRGIAAGQAGAEGRNEAEGGGAGVYMLLG